MANVKISELDPAAALDGSELIETVQSGTSVRTTTQDIANLGGSSYLVYTALLTQAGTDAPVATVLENTLGGTVVWTRGGAGWYIGTLAGAFAGGDTKVWVTLFIGNAGVYIPQAGWYNANQVWIQSYSMTEVLEDSWLNLSPVEIRVYP